MESSWPGTETPANLSPKPSNPTLAKSDHWTFLPTVQCWQLVHGTKRQSYGARKLRKWKEIQSIVVKMSTAFGFRRLANFLPSRQTVISKYGIHARGNAWQNSRQRSTGQ